MDLVLTTSLSCVPFDGGVRRESSVHIEHAMADAAIENQPLEGHKIIDAHGLIALPGLIDAHTHSRGWFTG